MPKILSQLNQTLTVRSSLCLLRFLNSSFRLFLLSLIVDFFDLTSFDFFSRSWIVEYWWSNLEVSERIWDTWRLMISLSKLSQSKLRAILSTSYINASWYQFMFWDIFQLSQFQSQIIADIHLSLSSKREQFWSDWLIAVTWFLPLSRWYDVIRTIPQWRIGVDWVILDHLAVKVITNKNVRQCQITERI